MKAEIVIALYMRLSKEDEMIRQESNSITNQRFLLKSYVRKHFSDCEVLEFVDDGYSGTNFDRPAMKRLLELAKKGKINCIIVKDFSRFARDYVEAGSYIEQIFPFLGIRFISVNDDYDSRNYAGSAAGMNQSFKHLTNDLYSKDLSVKVKSSLDSKKERGIYCSANCPFGYRKKENNRNQVEIVEEEARIIRRIFQMTLEGYTSNGIARQFTREKIKTPIEYLMERGAAYRKPAGTRFSWNNTAICSVLRNDFYTGDVVYGKYEKAAVGGKSHLKPRSEWKIYYNHHAPIIDRETFNAVQATRGKRKGKQYRESHPLQGRVVCGECGKALSMRHSLNPYFYCRNRYDTENDNCLQKANIQFWEQILLAALQKEIKKQSDSVKLRKVYREVLNKRRRDISGNSQDTKKELLSLSREKLTAYEQYVRKDVTYEEYQEIKDTLEEKEKALERTVKEQEECLERIEGAMIKADSEPDWSFHQQMVNKIDRETVKLFINKVKIWNDGEIEIIWNFRNCYKVQAEAFAAEAVRI